MKQKINVIFLAVCLLFGACKPELAPPEEFTGNPEDIGLSMDLLHLTLDKTELATIAGHDLKLTVTKSPEFATTSEIEWSSSNEDVARVEQDGTIHTSLPSGTYLETAVIRVASVDDPSIYAECPVTVCIVSNGSNRYWNFGPNGWYASDENDPQHTLFSTMGFPTNTGSSSNSFTPSDLYMGNGMTLKGQTGSGDYVNPDETPNKLPLEGGLIPSDADKSIYPPYPWVYEIDPVNPYAAGLTPTRSIRGSMYWRDDTPPAEMHSRQGDLVTGGVGRTLSIAALQGPFSIEVRYATNSDNSARWADIRIGDTSGFRIQGSPSDKYATPGIASYTYTKDDIVPFVYIEAQGSLRVYEVIIKEVDISYKPVENVTISGNSTVKNGSTITLNAALTPTNATDPEYTWTLVGTGAAIDGSASGATVKIKGSADSGSVTVKLTVTTTDPDTKEVTTKSAADKIITLDAASSGAYEWNAATSAAFSLSSATPNAAINGKTWRRTGGTITFTAGSAGLTLNNGRFLIGSNLATDTSATDYDPDGELDFSTKKKISITYTATAATGNFIVYINNNTSTQASSVLGNSNRIQNAAPVTPGTTWTYTVDPATFSNHASLATAFLQIRCDSSATIVISRILIEDVD
jgi:uncharacterized protein YjdB